MIRKLSRSYTKLVYRIRRFDLDISSVKTLIYGFSRGRAKNLSELSEKECEEYYQHLKKSLKKEMRSPEADSIRTIKKLCQDLGWITEDGQACENILNCFLLKHSNEERKQFDDMSADDLSFLIERLSFFVKELPYPSIRVIPME